MKISEIIKSFILISLITGAFILSCNRQTEKTVATEMASDANIRLSEAQIQLANIKVAEVKEGTISRNLILTGSLKVNEQSSVSITSRSAGRIEKLFFKTTGEKINAGDSLYNFYSDDLVAAEKEYFTIQSGNWNYSGQYPPSLLLENKMLYLGMIPAQMAKLRKDGNILFTIPIISQVRGTIRSVYVSEGQYVEAGEKLFDLAMDNTLWVEALAYAGDLSALRTGMPAKVIISSGTNIEIPARITTINPSFEPGKNYALVRTTIDNSSRKLYPGMMALLNVESQKNKGIIIPVSAVLVDKAGSRVWVRDENGIFSDRIITTGIQTSDSVIVMSGLNRSEMVVTSGAYLLNSEMILKRGNI